ncbi:MAG: bifunctional nuclease family protein [Spirochaetales bacterium]|nr:bifunctional nuclease family protein [Spirochaetales bacterium]
MSSPTFVEAEVWTVAQTEQGNVVLVRPKGSDLTVPIFIGQLETQSILIGLGRVDVPRPLTHDLVLSLIGSLGAGLARVEINELREGTFFARLVVVRDGQESLVDSRPSDALALAVRAGCPVYIAESVVDEAGISVNLVSDRGGSGLVEIDPFRAVEATPAPPPAREDRERLRAELEEAISEEDYERAALLRDRLRDLEGA